ncbi:S-adenosyl-L-methionine-dependent methyltransferase [Roridomyces roridus]|uniref:S-adenosyl-L-methionine-dependent methyltransferase n=1 Tax=Roridomyces roridus TaxID=1738132 RepID=A0AAD7BJH8_9AGAR|nr:S-adenosyl-L-methionine-dependent methyltransferase [Roridomyces roridus]
MSAFAKGAFNAAKYAASRPTYPRAVFDSVLAYHAESLRKPGVTAQWKKALDLGCGTGQATTELLRQPSPPEEQEDENFTETTPGFDQVIGVDPSAKMVAGGQAAAAALDLPESTLKFVQSAAEDLSFVEDKSVDLVIAAQAAHWFDWERMWPELSRVLKYGGTAAFWVYSEFRLPQYPHLTPLISEYAGTQGTNPYTTLGPHWEPGRKILANHLLDIAPPSTGWDDVTRVFFTGEHYPELPEPHLPAMMRKTMTWGGAGLHGYLKTFSALQSYHEAFPEDLERADGDIATRFLRTLMEKAEVPLGEEGENATVEVEWPLALVIARKELDPTDPWHIRLQSFQSRMNELKIPYDQESSESEDPTDLEQSREKLDKWIAVQEQVLQVVEDDLVALAEDETLMAEANEETAASESEEEQDEEPDVDEDSGFARYVTAIEETRTAVSWHLTFKGALDYSLDLAEEIETEGGLDNAAGVERWIELMNEKIGSLAPPDPAEGQEELTEEELAEITDEQMAGFEEAEALAGILAIVQELVESVPSEPIGDLVRGLYITSSAEVARQVLVE